MGLKNLRDNLLSYIPRT